MELIEYLKEGYPIIVHNIKEVKYVIDIARENGLVSGIDAIRLTSVFEGTYFDDKYLRYGNIFSHVRLRHGNVSRYINKYPFINACDFMTNFQISQDTLLNFLEEDNV